MGAFPRQKRRHISEEEGECRAFPQRICLCHMQYHASGLYQRGADEEGFFGFLFPSVEQELQRVAQKKCCVCRKQGASVRCHCRRCSRTFHYPCGRERGCVSQFFGEYRSFCWQHRPTQQVKPLQREQPQCAICLEAVEGRPSYHPHLSLLHQRAVPPPLHAGRQHCLQTTTASSPNPAALASSPALGQRARTPSSRSAFPRAKLCALPCTTSAARSARTCRPSRQRCFASASKSQTGQHPPCHHLLLHRAQLSPAPSHRDAAWEVEEGAFHNLYQRHSSCDTDLCLCPIGRDYSENTG
ncbi:LOW QUALITY PROTEIN: PHD finger protein 7-like [Phasianus colchicus]|uniref:LOW QUALITY PROTEIN: PHD finger protein 7-like n=1 Tax=Phasianus colchicus TaxID=9054 RepID=UPI00129D5F84|nr:LOW QUALITY PROTEIN: PHD finger protein 7-like [Phasianus colchicus]